MYGSPYGLSPWPHSYIERKKESPVAIRLPEIHDRLSYPDSNQDRQNQKLQCYHYTIRQSMTLSNQIIR